MKVCTFLTDGFETVEALAVVDILRRAGVIVDTISISGNNKVMSAQNVQVTADYMFETYNFDDVDMLFLPGGPGHKHYESCKELMNLLVNWNDEEKKIAAICAAPSVLGHLGILKDRKAVCFPGYEKDLVGAEVLCAPVRVVTDGNITTSRGMGTSVDLGLELVSILTDSDTAEELGKTIQYID